jgi:hypothetical protein
VRGVARAAIDEAARAGAALDATVTDCEQRARDVLDGVVTSGAVHVTCRDRGDVMRAHARVVLAGWFPGIPSWTMELEGEVVKEQLP